jgi:hypothetical protein
MVVVVGGMAGVGWVLSASRGGRPDIRSAVAFAPPEQKQAATPATEIASRWPADEAAQTARPRPFKMPVDNPMGGLALLIPKSFAAKPRHPAHHADDDIVTRSIDRTPPKPAPTVLASASIALPRPLETPPVPMPPARPRLAALNPEDLGIKRNDDSRPPRTAIYDISASTVYLPGGERLEAHSGLGHLMDDPSSMRVKNRGVTPPNIYRLTLRESLFHGVQALRMTPQNEDDMFGRAGILAHSYMLGPSGQSNGCVSFKDYPKFLEAFRRGEVDRIVVVTRLDRPPALAARARAVQPIRSASNVSRVAIQRSAADEGIHSQVAIVW